MRMSKYLVTSSSVVGHGPTAMSGESRSPTSAASTRKRGRRPGRGPLVTAAALPDLDLRTDRRAAEGPARAVRAELRDDPGEAQLAELVGRPALRRRALHRRTGRPGERGAHRRARSTCDREVDLALDPRPGALEGEGG